MSTTAKEATQRFRDKFESLGFTLEQSKNDAVDYSKEKEKRDTQAVKDFLKTREFDYIKKMK